MGWDALDEEEVEAMKKVSSAVTVEELTMQDFDQYPRFVVRNFGSLKPGTRVDALLKLLLLPTRLVQNKQNEQLEKARQAALVRERKEKIKKAKKKIEKIKRQRRGYSMY
eukprot:CAMPEP_0118719954 /NCGR_PEP_ID=MMETSP0800-20121206/29821_1 /TAXON_ID=210618 ORGANISM="Striatella unipunctata, Strain CCMP2910" /NCGR_SAMPLE_ID=MMETSP0800 /ASSEMBLY_ACC=CAM_ASM_000638 /LENGTH=109 /DNA_ID=CAMNT_0006627499 /DNA_START=217 /DNA_END=546 /DNA_ORIENTATION=-